MITVNNVSLSFDGTTLFSDVNLKFTPGNCYGIIGANGAGKSTFLKILSGVKDPTTGEIIIPANVRMSVLKQDHYAYDEYTVMDTAFDPTGRWMSGVEAALPYLDLFMPSIEEAEKLANEIKKDLNDTSVYISQISEKYKFTSVSSFSKFFSRVTGITPSNYRKENSNR